MGETIVTTCKETHIDQLSPKNSTTEGVFKGLSKEYIVFAYTNTEEVTQLISEFIQQINEVQAEGEIQAEIFVVNPEEIENPSLIDQILHELAETKEEGKDFFSQLKTGEKTLYSKSQTQNKELPKENSLPKETAKEPVYSSIFTLASSISKTRSSLLPNLKELKKQKENTQSSSPSTTRQENTKQERHLENLKRELQKEYNDIQASSKKDLLEERKDQKREKEDSGQQHKEKEDQRHKAFEEEKRFEKRSVSRKESIFTLQAMQASAPQNQSPSNDIKVDAKGPTTVNKKPPFPHTGNIFIRFMSLMARILGQAEAEAHELYNRIKDRTDNIDTLTLLTSKINSAKGAIDWEKDEEMKQLVNKVRGLGVDIPEGKYKWSEEEKKLLKENIQMKKDSMEKITQLERTDMQRFLQEASQCHQARSNLLKLMKEVVDTIVHNIRP